MFADTPSTNTALSPYIYSSRIRGTFKDLNLQTDLLHETTRSLMNFAVNTAVPIIWFNVFKFGDGDFEGCRTAMKFALCHKLFFTYVWYILINSTLCLM